jgi:hypothetical protein
VVALEVNQVVALEVNQVVALEVNQVVALEVQLQLLQHQVALDRVLIAGLEQLPQQCQQ